MPDGFEIIRARIKDDAVVLIDRLMRSKQHEVVLVLPKNSIISADLRSLKILKEEAESIGKILSVSTENDEIKSFASKIDMSLYNPNNTRESETAGTIKITRKIKVMMDILPPSFVDRSAEDEEVKEESQKEDLGEGENVVTEVPEFLPELPKVNIYEVSSKNSDLEKNIESFYETGVKDSLPNPKICSSVFSINRLITFFTVIGVLLFSAAMYLILPKAEIKISLKELPIKVQIPVAISKNVHSPDLVSGIIPAQYFSQSKAGSKTVESSKRAGGSIEIYNAYSAAPQRLVAQTRFETKDGKIFRIKSSVIIPGAKMSGTKLTPSSIKADVVADLAGEEYLIGPTFFTITGFKDTLKYAGFYAKSVEPMTMVESVGLTKEDIEQNKNELRESLAQELKSDTLSTLQDSNLQLIDGASLIAVNDFKISSDKGANGNIISMKISWQALFFKEKDLRDLVSYFVSSRYPDLKNFTFEDTITYPKVNRADFKKGELFFTFDIQKDNALTADIAALKKELAGHGESEMRAVVSDKSYIHSAAISLWPFWVTKAPNNLSKINITIDPSP